MGYLAAELLQEAPTGHIVPSLSSADGPEPFVNQAEAENEGQTPASCQQQCTADAALLQTFQEPQKAANDAKVHHVMFASTQGSGDLHDDEQFSRTATSSMASASTSHSRRHSLLGETGRSSRRSSSFRDSLTDSSLPPVLQVSRRQF